MLNIKIPLTSNGFLWSPCIFYSKRTEWEFSIKNPNLIRAYENVTGKLRRPPLTGQHSLVNNFNKFAVECTTCDERAICLPAGKSSGLQIDEVKCDCGQGSEFKLIMDNHR